MALLFSPSLTTAAFPTSSSPKPQLLLRTQLTVLTKRTAGLSSLFLCRSADNGAGPVSSPAAVIEEEKSEKKEEEEEEAAAAAAAPTPKPSSKEEKKEEEPLSSNGAAAVVTPLPKFKEPRWIGGTWELKQFQKDGRTDWDAVIDAEARRRKWLEDNPEASNTDEPVVFDTSIIPWWAWIKRFHLPEAELLNGRAAMIGFFMAYFVDSLTGAGLVDQMGNFFCKTLLFVAVVGVLLIRKNEDVEKLKKLIEETTFYDKQWQATWLEDKTSDSATK